MNAPGCAAIAGALWLVPRQALRRATNVPSFDFVVRGKRSAPAIVAQKYVRPKAPPLQRPAI
ncbi:MAG TPA: hypothetical protein DEA72_02115 [Halomonas campaniensis]|nr:hypothetical protein [Halomonas campaniensis]